jgi:hypothetical protein
VVVTSNKPFGRWGEVFGDPVVAAAMIDRLVHHAEVVNLKGGQLSIEGPRHGEDGAYRRAELRPRTARGVNFQPSLTG